MDLSLAHRHFYQVVHQRDFSLAQAALYIAQAEYPDLEVDRYLEKLAQMAREVKNRLPQERYPLRLIQTINQYLYEDLSFKGNTRDYYDPRNSFLNEVIDRRTGIPISLSLVYIEIAQRLDLPMVGVGMPGHFLLRPDLPDMDLYVDPFYQGETLFAQDCQDRLKEIFGSTETLQPDFLKPISPHQFLARMLTNLKHIYLRQNQVTKSLRVIEQILIVLPNAVAEIRDRGILYYQLGQWDASRQDLETYLARSPQLEDVSLIHQLLNHMDQA